MAKMRVHLLTEYESPNSFALNYPLLIHRPFFNKKGIEIHLYERLCNKIYECDVIFINNKFFGTWHNEKIQELYNTLAGFKDRVQKVIWFDMTDSTGTTQFNIIPFVDGYYKSQVLKDRSLYAKSLYGYRIFTDYYNATFGIRDNEEPFDNVEQKSSVSILLPSEHAHKLHIGWNSAMNEWGSYSYLCGELAAKIRSHLPFRTDYTTRFIETGKNRNIDINGRIGLSHSRNTVRYQRQVITDMLKQKFNVPTSKISRRQYLNELRNSKIGVSPFGLGEISCRDFEIIINGALLFKGDMSHLDTWPPIYVANETYVPYAWDLEDFEEKLSGLLGDKERIAGISRKAQELYSYYLYGNGRLEFCNKVLDIIMGTNSKCETSGVSTRGFE